MKTALTSLLLFLVLFQGNAQNYLDVNNYSPESDTLQFYRKLQPYYTKSLTHSDYQEISTIKSNLRFSKGIGILATATTISPIYLLSLAALPGQRITLREPTRRKLGRLISRFNKDTLINHPSSELYPTLEKLKTAYYYLDRANKQTKKGQLITIGLSLPLIAFVSSISYRRYRNPYPNFIPPAICISGILITYFTISIKNISLTHRAIKSLKSIPAPQGY
jgi:hypothetical protein